MFSNEMTATGTGDRFFDFRSLAGLRVNNVSDIPFTFYTLVPTRYKPLYIELLRTRQWLLGYVPGVHGRLLSSGIVAKFVDLITNKITSGGYKFSGDVKNEDLLKKWDKKVNFQSSLLEWIWNTEAMGYGFAKINIKDGVPYVEQIFADQAYFTTDERGIVDFRCATVKLDGNKDNELIYKIEHRYYDSDTNIPMIEHYFIKDVSQYTQGDEYLFSDQFNLSKFSPSNEILLKLGVPKGQFTRYRKEMEARPLPMRDLGVYQMKATVHNPNYVKFDIGQSIASQIGEDNLVRYDLAFSLEGHEITTTPKTVLVPPELENGKTGLLINGEDYQPTSYNFSPSVKQLNHTYYAGVPYENSSGEKVQPTFIEPTIRSTQIREAKISILRDACISLGLSANELEQLSGGVYQSKDSLGNIITSDTISARRSLVRQAVNQLLKSILWIYGFKELDNINIIWTNEKIDDLANLVNTYATGVKNFLFSKEYAVRKLHPDMTETEIQEELRKIKETQQDIVETFYGGNKAEDTNIVTGDNTHNESIKKVENGKTRNK